MNYIKRMYSEMKDLRGTINILEEQLEQINCEFEDIMIEVRETDFNVSQSIEMYKRLQQFLQERRLLKSQIEEMKVQYEILGGDVQLERYNKALDFKKVKCNPHYKKDKKYYRNKKYYENFNEDIKNDIYNLYHIV